MKQQVLFGLGVAMLLGASWSSAALFASNAAPSVTDFDELRMHVEVDLPSRSGAVRARSAFSPDLLGLPAEVVLSASAHRSFDRIRMRDAAGRLRFELACPSGTTLGISELSLECEGVTLATALREFPPGDYFVEATTIDGGLVEGTVELRAGLPGLFAVVSPAAGEALSADDVTIAWTPSRGAARYLLEVEQEETEFSFSITLSPSRTHFTLPAHVLEPGRPYEYSLVVQGDTDNELEVEGSFVTLDQNLMEPTEFGR